jgi:uncharacterized protein
MYAKSYAELIHMDDGKNKKQAVVRALWITVGFICLFFGAIGMVLPILPTTPFLLAASACFCKSSPKLNFWLLNNKWFGNYIKNYKAGKGLPLKTKITVLAVLWATIGFSTVFLLNRFLPSMLLLPMQLVMVAVAVAVSVHIVRLPTFKKGQ